jgi:hypothetical protein
MSKDGLTIEETAVISQVNEKKKSRSTTNNHSLQQANDSQYQQPTDRIEQLDLIDESKVIFFSSSFKY